MRYYHNISWLHGNILGESQKFLTFCYSFKEFSGMANKYIGCPFCVLDVSVCSQFVPRHILLQNMFFVNDGFQGKCQALKIKTLQCFFKCNILNNTQIQDAFQEKYCPFENENQLLQIILLVGIISTMWFFPLDVFCCC